MQVNGNNSGQAAESWLAPRPKCSAGRIENSNEVTVVLPHAVALSKLRIWNYFKSPERGVCEVDVFLDDHLIYFGFLKKATTPGDFQTLLFSNHPGDLASDQRRVKHTVPEMDKNHLTLINEGTVKDKGRAVIDARPLSSERPATAVVC